MQVHVPGRTADERQLAALHRALDKHYHLSAGQKVAEFFEGVVTSVQVGSMCEGFRVFKVGQQEPDIARSDGQALPPQCTPRGGQSVAEFFEGVVTSVQVG